MAKTNLYAMLFIIAGGVYGLLFLELGVPKETTLIFGMFSLVCALVALAGGAVIDHRNSGPSENVGDSA